MTPEESAEMDRLRRENITIKYELAQIKRHLYSEAGFRALLLIDHLKQNVIKSNPFGIMTSTECAAFLKSHDQRSIENYHINAIMKLAAIMDDRVTYQQSFDEKGKLIWSLVLSRKKHGIYNPYKNPPDVKK